MAVIRSGSISTPFFGYSMTHEINMICIYLSFLVIQFDAFFSAPLQECFHVFIMCGEIRAMHDDVISYTRHTWEIR